MHFDFGIVLWNENNLKGNFMNLIKNMAVGNLSEIVEKTFMPFNKSKKVATGLCLTCDNRPHCIWQENRKQFCEHFE